MSPGADISVVELTAEEGKKLLDRQARRYFQISGDEFIAKWEAGAFDDEDDERPEVMRVAMLIPFGR